MRKFTWRRSIGFLVAFALLFIGAKALFHQFVQAETSNGMAVMLGGILATTGAIWLAGDFILPRWAAGRRLTAAADAASTKGNAIIGAVFSKIGDLVAALARLLFWLLGAALAFAAVACWVLQVFGWLKDGRWTPVPIAAFVPLKSTGWLGADKILDWMMSFNVGVPLLIIGVWIMVLLATSRE